MKRLVIVADSHGHLGKIYDLLNKEIGKFNLFIHLGDRAYDVVPFLNKFPIKDKVVLINGNVEPPDKAPGKEEVILKVEGLRIFLTHGFKYEVHKTIKKLLKKAKELKVDAVFYGHAHKPFKDTVKGVFFFSPGALQDDLYGEVIVDNKQILSANVLKLEDEVD